MSKRNYARERIGTDAGFQPQFNHYPDCPCKDCVHAYEDITGSDGTVYLHGYDGAACKVYDGKPDGILEGEVECPEYKTK